MPGRLRFRPKVFLTVIMLLFVWLTISLGNWQTGRAAEKAELQARLDAQRAAPPRVLPATVVEPEDWRHRRASVRGEWVSEALVLLDNKVHKGAAGYHVVMPLRLVDSNIHVLVNRGWVSNAGRRDVLPSIATPAGVQQLEGVGVPVASPGDEHAQAVDPGPVQQKLDSARIAARHRIVLHPILLMQTVGSEDNLVRDWPRPDALVNTHKAYALQWYAMALTAVILWVVLNVKRSCEAES